MLRFWPLPLVLMFSSALAAQEEAAAADAPPPTEAGADAAAPAGAEDLQALPDDKQAELLLDRDDPRAKEGKLVGSRGIDPGWKDSRVAERSPNVWGQNGLVRVNSARANKSGYFDIGLHARGFYSDDFVADGADRNTFVYGTGTFGFSIFDIAELGLAMQFANNENTLSAQPVLATSGDFATSLKIDLTAIPALFGISLMPVAAGFDVRAFIPVRQGAIGPDVTNFSLAANALFTVDLYEAYDWPFKLHLNAGYVYQNAHYLPLDEATRERYYLDDGVPEHLFALTTQTWWYDQVTAGAGIEFPFPYVTPFVEAWLQAPINVPAGYGANGGNYNYLTDMHTIITPGLRISAGRGLHFDLGADIGVTGNAGYLTPSLDKLVAGQPINHLWAAHIGVSYTFSPFVAETQVEVREKGVPLGQVKGCVVDDTSSAPVEEAYVEFTGTTGPRIVVDDQGCFESPRLDVGPLVVKVKHPDYKPSDVTVEILEDQVADARVRLVPAPRFGRFKGNLTNEEDQPVDGTIELKDDAGQVVATSTSGGAFDVEVKPGRYQALIKAEGFLQQGAPVLVEPLGRTIRNFVLKPIPKKRISVLTKDRIEINSKVPFEFNKARLLRAAEFILDDVVDVILSNPQVGVIRVEGHTDNTGEATYNQELSEARAEAVMEYLVAKGVPRERLTAKGYGFTQPIASNSTEEGRAQNRRVEFVIVEQAGEEPSTPAPGAGGAE